MKIKRIKRLIESLNEREIKQLNILMEKEYMPHAGNMFLNDPKFSEEERKSYSLKDENIGSISDYWNTDLVKPGMRIKVADLVNEGNWLEGTILGFPKDRNNRLMYVGFEDGTYTALDAAFKRHGEDYIIE